MALLVCIPAVCSGKFIYIFFKQTLIFLDVEQAVFEIGVIFVVVLATSAGFFFPPLSLLYSAQRSHGSLLCYSCGPARTRVRTSAYSINRGEAGARPLSSPQQLFDDTTVLEANKLSSIHVATHSCVPKRQA